MASRKKYEAVAIIGTYTASNGAEKKRYLNVGTVFENDDGRLSLKLDAVPVGQEWSGWISFFEPKEREQGKQQRPAQDAHNQSKANGYQPQPDLPQDRRTSPGMPPAPKGDDSDEVDDIPF